MGEGSRKVVHHALSYSVDQGENAQNDGDDSRVGRRAVPRRVRLGEERRGLPATTPACCCRPVRTLQARLPLHSVGEDGRRTRSSSASSSIRRAHVPKHMRWSKQLGSTTTELDIPAGTRWSAHRRLHASEQGRRDHRVPAAHAHPRQVSVPRADLPDSSRVATEMINCAHFNYNWHLVYNYADDVAPIVPAGTLLHIISWHDNTAANKDNPDPKNWVGNGHAPSTRWAFAWIGWVRPDRRGVQGGVGGAEGHTSAPVEAQSDGAAGPVRHWGDQWC